MKVNKKSVSPTSFSHGCFQGNLFSFKNESEISKTLFYCTLLLSSSRIADAVGL